MDKGTIYQWIDDIEIRNNLPSKTTNTSIVDKAPISITVLPNPVKEEATIQMDGLTRNLNIFNHCGNLILSSSCTNGLTINMQSWPVGLYLFKFDDANRNFQSAIKILKY